MNELDPWANQSRRTPYTSIGIKRLQCIRCRTPAVHQWQICADKNTFRPLCLDCDIALNRLVLDWAGDPNAETKVLEYALEQHIKQDEGK